MTTDLADLVARFTAALRAEGLIAGANRSARFARAITVVSPARPAELYRCALATLVSDPSEIPVLDKVFRAVFEGAADPAQFRGDRPSGTATGTDLRAVASAAARHARRAREVEVATTGNAVERLAARTFAELDADELATLAEAMRRLRMATPTRVSRRTRQTGGHGRIDLRETLRRARRTAAEPLRLSKRTPRRKPRRLVVLCDISGSMRAQARAMLQLLYCAAGAERAEVFTFATRLTRLTRLLTGRPDDALRRAGETAPDWAGGTRIGAALREFLNRYGVPGLARGAVVVLVSDGWETGDPAELGRQMARLRQVAYRVVWVNPRSASAGYRPLAGGMAAALPHCDAVVSADRLDRLDELLSAIGSAEPRPNRSAAADPLR